MDRAAGSDGGTLVASAAAGVGPGDRLGPRYEIVRQLGKGGMGAVYLARDLELGREVALKLIAPHLASEPSVIERFKREIQLSSLVTHPNVLRVYDLGEFEGVKFLTMQFIDGETLADLMQRERSVAPERAASLFRQVCDALAAAHDKGVLHRDLKPQNVMVDGAGRAYLTDFGLATSIELSTMTRTGAIMGTPQYMSPEQVRGEPVDARSDLFSAGLIFHEMLTGAPPYAGDTVFEMMMARTRAPPRPATQLNAAIPKKLQAVLDRCLQLDPKARYASAADIVRDLDGGSVAPRATGRGRGRTVAIAAAAVLVVAVAAGGWWRTRTPPPQVVAKPAQTVLVADFRNETGDKVFEGTLESAVGLALEGASFLSSYHRPSAQRIADELKLAGAGLGEERARLVAQREGIHVVTAGTIARNGAGYRIAMRAVDAFTGASILEHAEEAADKEQVLAVATRLAARLRGALGDTTPEAVQLKQAETFSAASLEAAHEYATARTFFDEGKYDDAERHYREAIRLDPGMGRAYSGMALVESNRGRSAEAAKWFKEALARVGRMSEREKHRTRGAYYLVVERDPDQAIEAFTALVSQFPADPAGLLNLPVAYQLKRDFPRALAEARKALETRPQDVVMRSNVGLFAAYAGHLDEAIAEHEKVLQVNPGFLYSHVGLAMAQLAAGRRDEAIATWERLRGLGSVNASAAVEGLADLAAYEGRLADARKLLETGIATDVAQKETDAAARKLVMLAGVQLAAGDTKAAITAAERAMKASHVEYLVYVAGTVLAEAGADRRALALADDLDRRVAAEPRMFAELVRGTVDLKARRAAEALEHFKAALQKGDAWPVRLALGRAFLDAGAFTQAHDQLESAARRRGEVTDVFLDVVPTFRMYPPVQLYLGRALEGLGSPAAADAYGEFLAMKKTDEELLVRDARARLAHLRPAVARP